MPKKKKLVMLNLASGYIGHDDWINIDYGILSFINAIPLLKKIVFGLKLAPASYNKPWPKNLRLINLRKDFPFESNSVDFIFTAHFIEHLQKYEAVHLFKECHRTLKKGGIIRILVPDLDIVAKQYLDNKNKLKRVEILNNHFWGILPKQDTPPTLHDKVLNFFSRGHNWLYNYEYMKKILMLGGFDAKNISRGKFKQSKVPNVDFLDNHPDHSLIVEAIK